MQVFFKWPYFIFGVSVKNLFWLSTSLQGGKHGVGVGLQGALKGRDKVQAGLPEPLLVRRVDGPRGLPHLGVSSAEGLVK